MIRETGDFPDETDVLVLGAGMAGHCAALAAADAGREVLLLEKAGQPGGSSAMAGGTFAFSGTDLMLAAGREDSLAAFRADLIEAGKGKNDPAMVDAFLADQLEGYELLRRHGVSFTLAANALRYHRTGTGAAITRLHLAARNHPRIAYFSRSAGVALARCSDGRVTQADVTFGDRLATVSARCGIVLATGGFSRSSELMQVFCPELLIGVRHGGVANTGDGLMMAATLGAGLADMGYVSGTFGGAIANYPRGQQGSDEVPPLLFSFQMGGVLVNRDAVRCVREDQPYKALCAAGLGQPEGVLFQIFDQAIMDQSLTDSSVNDFREGIVGGYIRRADTIGDLASAMGLDPAVLVATMDRYNADVAKGLDTEFGRQSNVRPITSPPYYVAATTVALTSTYGGITTDGSAAVTDWLGRPIEGIFAAGELVGGLHGAGYYSALSLAAAATFGMIAGKAAARHSSTRSCFSSEET